MSNGRRRSSDRIHVISRESGWAVKREGRSKASRVHRTKESAVKDARRQKEKGSDVIIHNKDGSIEKWEKGRR